MDPEHTFLRVHARLSGVLARLLTPKFRTALEYMCLFNAVMLLALLVVMHVNFVAQPGCAAEFSGTEAAEAQLIQVRITGSSRLEEYPLYEDQETADVGSRFWASISLRNSGAKASLAALDGVMGPSDNQGVPYDPVRTQQQSPALTASAGATVLHYLSKWSGYFANSVKRLEQSMRTFAQVWRITGWEPFAATPKGDRRAVAWNKLDSVIVDRMERRGKMYDPMYLYSVEKGYLILTEGAKFEHNIRTVNISVSAQNACFGNRWQRFLIDNFVGYDTILMNSLLTARGKGYLYNFQTKELYNLNYLQESGVSHGFEDYVVFKFGVLIMSLFVFFTTTMSVSFTLRETQARMLKFTVQLQYHARHRLPTFHLIFIHVFESLVFVPIMIGILFFLFEFFDDQLLAFMVLTLVWLCELFTMISVRTRVSMKYFPRFFFLYFMVFHIYLFSYTYGFSYLAFSTTAAFMQHLVLFFWNRLEVPALQSYLRRRALLQQGLQLTSSAFLTRIPRVSEVIPRSTPVGGPGLSATAEGSSGESSVDLGDGSVASVAAEVSTRTAGGPIIQAGPISAFGSVFPWTLGSPSTALVSFLPIFREFREQEPTGTTSVAADRVEATDDSRHRNSSESEGAG